MRCHWNIICNLMIIDDVAVIGFHTSNIHFCYWSVEKTKLRVVGTETETCCTIQNQSGKQMRCCISHTNVSIVMGTVSAWLVFFFNNQNWLLHNIYQWVVLCWMINKSCTYCANQKFWKHHKHLKSSFRAKVVQVPKYRMILFQLLVYKSLFKKGYVTQLMCLNIL